MADQAITDHVTDGMVSHYICDAGQKTLRQGGDTQV